MKDVKQVYVVRKSMNYGDSETIVGVYSSELRAMAVVDMVKDKDDNCLFTSVSYYSITLDKYEGN